VFSSREPILREKRGGGIGRGSVGWGEKCHGFRGSRAILVFAREGGKEESLTPWETFRKEKRKSSFSINCLRTKHQKGEEREGEEGNTPIGGWSKALKERRGGKTREECTGPATTLGTAKLFKEGGAGRGKKRLSAHPSIANVLNAQE